MSGVVHYERRDDVALITIDNPPVNAVGPGVPEGIVEALARANADNSIGAVVLTGGPRTFIAGADIKLLSAVSHGRVALPDLLSFLAAIENSPKPVVMAISGAAFGGGLETAMAGHYRLATPDAQLGQPEVKLGLIPGMQGTQRLPRLVGIERALQMCIEGEPIPAPQALRLGLIDELVETGLLDAACSFARRVANAPVVRIRDRNEKLPAPDPAMFAHWRRQAAKQRRLERAPQAAVDAIEAGTTLGFDRGCEREQVLFKECLESAQARALLYVFFSERAVSKIPGAAAVQKTSEVKRAAVIGAGTMGGGIAMTFANAGIPVIVKEASEAALERGMAAVYSNYAASVSKGRLSNGAMQERLDRITPQLTYENFDTADVAVEAVFENISAKKQVFTELARVANKGAILATNTSSLDIDEIASEIDRPGQVIGLHFFSPANVMRLVEVIRGTHTDAAVIDSTMKLAIKMGKIPVLARNEFGFIGNRMVLPYLRQAHLMLEEGASVEQVNTALYEFGMAMGPLAMEDLAGLDVLHQIRNEAQRRGHQRGRQPILPELLYQAERYGQKNGRGWSSYDESRRSQPDAVVAQIVCEARRTAGVPPREIPPQDIVRRCIYALINEGAKVLEEGVALRAMDIDAVYVHGYGFPAWRGGPMFYADTVGLGEILSALNELAQLHGAGFGEPAPLLKELALNGATFGEWDAKRLAR